MPDYRHALLAGSLVIGIAAGCSTADPGVDLSSNARQAIADSVRRLLTETYVFDGSDPVPRFMKLYADYRRRRIGSLGRLYPVP